MRYGYFDDARREYVISTPATPLPWINYLGSQDFLGMISNTGGGYCFYNMGVQKVSAQKASVISLWEMILGPLWVALFLKEYPSIPVMISFVIILIGMFLDAKMSGTPAESSN